MRQKREINDDSFDNAGSIKFFEVNVPEDAAWRFVFHADLRTS